MKFLQPLHHLKYLKKGPRSRRPAGDFESRAGAARARRLVAPERLVALAADVLVLPRDHDAPGLAAPVAAHDAPAIFSPTL